MEKLVLWGKDQVGKEDFRGNLNYKRLALCHIGLKHGENT